MCGVIFHYLVPAGTVRDDVFVNGIFYVVGQGFIRLMQMLVVPLVFCSIVCGASSIGDTKTLGTIGLKTLAFYLCTTALAVTVALSIGNLINPGRGVDMSSMVASDTSTLSGSANTDVSFTDTLLNIIPKNPVQALASGDMLAIIFFALFVGIILSTMGRKVEVVHRFFEQFNDIMMKMTSMVMYVAPIGVFCLLARTFANIGFDAFLPMVKYMLGVLLALAVQCLVVYMVLLTVFARINPVKFLKKFVSVMMFAFSTATSNATIPLNIETLEKKMGVDRRISSFTIPLGATINMDGTSLARLFVFFEKQPPRTPKPWQNQRLLAAKPPRTRYPFERRRQQPSQLPCPNGSSRWSSCSSRDRFCSPPSARRRCVGASGTRRCPARSPRPRPGPAS